jgi:hypothetical protein
MSLENNSEQNLNMETITILEIGQSVDGVRTNNKLHVPRTSEQIKFGKPCCDFQS